MSAALAAMLKKRSDNGLVVITESNASQVESHVSPKRPSMGTVVQTTITKGPTKCFICEKSVFKMEEIIAIGHAYHGACFTCGGTNADGCKKKLVRDGFLENKGQPYCKACHDKNFKIGASKGAVNNLMKSRPISVMLWGRKNKQASEEGGAPEVPAYVLASKKAAEEVSARIGAMNDFLEPAIYGKDPAPPAAAAPAFTGRALPPAPGSAQKRPSFMPVVPQNKCGACDKTVYKMEEIIAIGKSWHSGCFCCGGPSGADGCKRKLVRDNYEEHKEIPYCKTCYDKLFKSWVKDTKAASKLTLENLLINKRSSSRIIAKNIDLTAPDTTTTTTTTSSAVPPAAPSATGGSGGSVHVGRALPPPPPQREESVEALAAAPSIAERVIASNEAAAAANLFTSLKKPPAGSDDASTVPVTPATATGHNKSYIVGKTTAFSGANKCFKCAKTVYKMEEIIAVGQVWHTSCFCCGGMNTDGCNKTLTRDNYVDHDTQPYCNSCYNKQFRTKGFGYGNSFNTDFGGEKA